MAIMASTTTVAEGNPVVFTFDRADGDYAWRIIPEGFLPARGGDFASLTGTVTVASGSGSVTITPTDDSMGEADKNFRLAIYATSDTDFETPLDQSAVITITSEDTYTTSPETRGGGGEPDIVGLGGSAEITSATGGGEADDFVITRYQHGNVSISDGLGSNVIKFDFGVVITGYMETSTTNFFGTSISAVALTLDTGAVITADFPSGRYSYQIGDGAVLDYDAFKTAIGATGTNATSAIADDFAVEALSPVLDITSNTQTPSPITFGGGGDSDILGFASNSAITSATGGGAGDYFVITRHQQGNVSISDGLGSNVIKFDFGVVITGYMETSTTNFFGTSISAVALTLDTGAVITADFPSGRYSYQIGDGAVLDYAAFKTAIGATGTNATSAIAADFTVPLPSTGPMLPDTGTSYFRYDTDGFYLFDDTDNSGDRSGDTRVGSNTQIAPADTSGSNRMLIDGNITSDQSNLDLHGGDDVYEIDLASFGDGDPAGEQLDIEINDTEGTNYLLIIADPDRDAGDNTGTSADATRITGIQNFAAIGRVVLTLGADTDDDDTTIETIGTITIQSPNNSRIAYANGEDTVFVDAADLTATNFEASLAVTDTTTPDII